MVFIDLEHGKYKMEKASNENCAETGNPVESGEDSGAGASMVLDYEKGLEQVGGDEVLLKEVLQIFLDDIPRKLYELHEAFMKEDRDRIRRAGHSIKGAAANIAADAVQAAAHAIEKTALEIDMQSIKQKIGVLEDEIKKLETAINIALGK